MYIGLSANLDRRIKSHKNSLVANTHYNKHLQNSWTKYGQENFEFSIVEECILDILNDREIFWIDYFDTYKNGYNLNLGGDAGRGWIASEETKKKMRLNHANVTGINNPMYNKSIYSILSDNEIAQWKAKISKSNSGENNSFYGKKHTDEVKRTISIKNKAYYSTHNSSMLGKKHTLETRKKISKILKTKYQEGFSPSNIKVICLNTLKVFDSLKSAATIYGAPKTCISTCCSKKVKSAGKSDTGDPLVWMYYDDYMENKDTIHIDAKISEAKNSNKGKNNYMSRPILCINTGEIFDTAILAGTKHNVDNSSIGKCCKGKHNYAGKHISTGEKLIWKFYE